MTELENKFSKILEQMEAVIDVYKRELMSKDEAHSRLYFLSYEVELLAWEGKDATTKPGKESS